MPLDSKSPKETMTTEKSLYIRAIFLLFIPIIYKEMILKSMKNTLNFLNNYLIIEIKA